MLVSINCSWVITFCSCFFASRSGYGNGFVVVSVGSVDGEKRVVMVTIVSFFGGDSRYRGPNDEGGSD